MWRTPQPGSKQASSSWIPPISRHLTCRVANRKCKRPFRARLFFCAGAPSFPRCGKVLHAEVRSVQSSWDRGRPGCPFVALRRCARGRARSQARLFRQITHGRRYDLRRAFHVGTALAGTALVVVERDGTAGAKSRAQAEIRAVVIIIFVRTGGALDLEESVRATKPCRYRRGRRSRIVQREEFSLAIVAGIERGVLEHAIAILALDLDEGVVAVCDIAQGNGPVFDVCAIQVHRSSGAPVIGRLRVVSQPGGFPL